jgi:hypothetical protein
MLFPVIAVGLDQSGKLIDVYTGQDSAAAQAALHNAGQGGQITMGWVYKYPTPDVTLRFGPVTGSQDSTQA